MKIYLAGPMRGIPYFNFPAFNAAAAKLRGWGHEVFNPAERDIDIHGAGIADNPTGDEKEAEKAHGFSLRGALADDTSWICCNAEGIALLPGWDNSKGAIAEKALGGALGLIIGEVNAFQPVMGPGGTTYHHYDIPNPRRTLKDLLDGFDAETRKKYPVYDGFVAYFRDAMFRVSRVSWEGNEQHNPGEPLHWSRGKSTDQDNCVLRHLMAGDEEEHAAQCAWRALARLQLLLERKWNIKPPAGVK